MRVQFRCPCGLVLNVAADQLRSAGECPGCGRIVVVPDDALPTADVAQLTDAVRETRPKTEDVPAAAAAMAASHGTPVPAPVPDAAGDVIPDELAPEPLADDAEPIPEELILEAPEGVAEYEDAEEVVEEAEAPKLRSPEARRARRHEARDARHAHLPRARAEVPHPDAALGEGQGREGRRVEARGCARTRQRGPAARVAPRSPRRDREARGPPPDEGRGHRDGAEEG